MASARNENLANLERFFRTERPEFERISDDWDLMSKTFLERVVICSTQCEYLITKIQQQSRSILDILCHTSCDANLAEWQGTLEYGWFSQLSILLDRYKCSVLATEDLLYLCAEVDWKLAALSVFLPATFASCQSRFAPVARDLDCTYYMIRVLLKVPIAERYPLMAVSFSVASNQDRSIALHKLDSGASKGSVHRERYDTLLRKRFQEDASPSTPGWVPDWCWIPGKLEYSIVGVLGRGSSKVVKKCQWLGLDVAVSYYGCGCPKIVLEGEAGILASVQHPNVVNMFGCAYDEKKQEGHIVTELMEQDLHDLIRVESQGDGEMPFSPSVSSDIMLQIVEAMIHVHKCRVLHRDLKPSNCLVSAKKRIRSNSSWAWETYYLVKLSGFDAAKVLGPDEPTCDERKVGTTQYMAPEVRAMTDDYVYSWSADVYSFGMTMYEIFTGKYPFDGFFSRLELASRVCGGERPSLPEYVPGFWKQLIQKCWHTDPDHRPSFEEIREEIIGGSLKLEWADWEYHSYVMVRIFHTWEEFMENPKFHLVLRSQRPTLERILRIQYSVEEFRKRVVICSTQAGFLITKIQQLSSRILDEISRALNSKLGDWQLQECELALALLNRFMCNLVAAEDLLYQCAVDDWKLAALSVFLPASCAAGHSKFSVVARDLDCTYDKILTVLGSPTAEQSTSTSLDLSVASNQDRSDVLEKLEGGKSKWSSGWKIYDFVLGRKLPKEGSAHLEMYTSLLRKRFQEGASPSTPGLVPDWCWIPGELKYTYVGNVGSGTFKMVLKCEWLGLDVAIAVYKGVHAKNDVEAEAGMLASVQHPNVVNMFGCAYDEKKKEGYLVTELMEQDLCQLIRERVESRRDGEMPFSLSVTSDIILQIVEAMIHVHKCRVLHRDLKPANCLVSGRKRIVDLKGAKGKDQETYYVVKVIDFGASKVRGADASTCHTRKRGTTAYMAPELHAKEEECAYKWSADVYSFGMTMYEIFTGKSPFEGVYRGGELVRRVCGGERPSLPEYVPVFWRQLIEECWHRDPGQRPSFERIRECI